MGEALTRLETLVASGYTEDRFSELESALIEIMNTPILTQEENMRLYEVGIGLILQGYPLLEQETETYNFITGQMLAKGFKSPFDDRYSRNWNWLNSAAGNLVTHMFKEIVERITPEHETVGYIEMSQAQFGGSGGTRFRDGFVVITQERMFIVGYESMTKETYTKKSFLYYPDLQTQPYFGSIDYIHLKNITGTRLEHGRKHPRIEIDLSDVEFFTKEAKHFFGPLFFKTRLADKVQRHIGPFQLVLRIPKPPDQSKQDYRRRLEGLTDVLSGRVLM